MFATLFTLLLLALASRLEEAECRAMTMDERIKAASPIGETARFFQEEGSDVVVVEYDVMYKQEDYQRLLAEMLAPGQTDRSKRKAIRALSTRWPDAVIPYKIKTADFNSHELGVIKDSMAEWEARTCLKFREANSADKNFIHIMNGPGCTSYVGKTGYSGQTVSLGPGCRVKSIVIHELGHALGFHHEQHRPDRDGYITVLEENVQPSYRFALARYSEQEINDYGIPYDYSSIMHYGEYAFTSNGQQTIITKTKSWQHRIGTGEIMSFADIKLANTIYQCADHCDGVSCRDDGFLDKDCVCQCKADPTHRCDSGDEDGPGYRGMECADKNDNCAWWASVGECEKNPAYMLANCGISCDVCHDDDSDGEDNNSGEESDCQDDNASCAAWASWGECEANPGYMLINCRKSCDVCGRDGDPSCVDDNVSCAAWAAIGECEINPNYMLVNCKKSCEQC